MPVSEMYNSFRVNETFIQNVLNIKHKTNETDGQVCNTLLHRRFTQLLTLHQSPWIIMHSINAGIAHLIVLAIL